jgi:hypothetical protein
MPCQHCQNTRTSQQNRSLYLLFKQISDECLAKGIEMRELVRDEVPIPCTPENIKWMWKLLQNAMFGTKSTTELRKSGDIDKVYDAFNRILIERTQGEIQLPPWPSMESLMSK